MKRRKVSFNKWEQIAAVKDRVSVRGYIHHEDFSLGIGSDGVGLGFRLCVLRKGDEYFGIKYTQNGDELMFEDTTALIPLMAIPVETFEYYRRDGEPL